MVLFIHTTITMAPHNPYRGRHRALTFAIPAKVYHLTCPPGSIYTMKPHSVVMHINQIRPYITHRLPPLCRPDRNQRCHSILITRLYHKVTNLPINNNNNHLFHNTCISKNHLARFPRHKYHLANHSLLNRKISSPQRYMYHPPSRLKHTLVAHLYRNRNPFLHLSNLVYLHPLMTTDRYL
jgi:hypothetical protein